MAYNPGGKSYVEILQQDIRISVYDSKHRVIQINILKCVLPV